MRVRIEPWLAKISLKNGNQKKIRVFFCSSGFFWYVKFIIPRFFRQCFFSSWIDRKKYLFDKKPGPFRLLLGNLFHFDCQGEVPAESQMCLQRNEPRRVSFSTTNPKAPKFKSAKTFLTMAISSRISPNCEARSVSSSLTRWLTISRCVMSSLASNCACNDNETSNTTVDWLIDSCKHEHQSTHLIDWLIDWLMACGTNYEIIAIDASNTHHNGFQNFIGNRREDSLVVIHAENLIEFGQILLHRSMKDAQGNVDILKIYNDITSTNLLNSSLIPRKNYPHLYCRWRRVRCAAGIGRRRWSASGPREWWNACPLPQRNFALPETDRKWPRDGPHPLQYRTALKFTFSFTTSGNFFTNNTAKNI